MLHDFRDHSRPSPATGALRLTNECRVFPSPWHRLVHGLGLGQQPCGYNAAIARSLAGLNQAGHRDREFYRALIEAVLAVCAESNGGIQTRRTVDAHFNRAIARLPQDPWQYARACAVLTECVVKLGQLERCGSAVRWHLAAAWTKVEALAPRAAKDRYERLLLTVNLFMASAQAGWVDLAASRIEGALRASEAIPDLFYRGRGAALLFTALAAVGRGAAICDGAHDYLRALLTAFDAELEPLSARAPDGVHAGIDYSLFPLSLTLNAMALLNRPHYLHYRRDWARQAATYFSALPPRSQASQLMFYALSLANLGVLHEHATDIGELFDACVHRYLQVTAGDAIDDYLRCAYLIHMGRYLGRDVPPAVWDILAAALARATNAPAATGYGSIYRVAAYALSAADAGDIELSFDKAGDLPAVIASCGDGTMAVAADRTTWDFALVDAALRLRPTVAGDTALFCGVTFQGASADPNFFPLNI